MFVFHYNWYSFKLSTIGGTRVAGVGGADLGFAHSLSQHMLWQLSIL